MDKMEKKNVSLEERTPGKLPNFSYMRGFEF
jgi:hypothetical protein